MPITDSDKLDIRYREGFDEAKASAAELVLICSALPELLAELRIGGETLERKGHGRRAVRSGIDDEAG